MYEIQPRATNTLSAKAAETDITPQDHVWSDAKNVMICLDNSDLKIYQLPAKLEKNHYINEVVILNNYWVVK